MSGERQDISNYRDSSLRAMLNHPASWGVSDILLRVKFSCPVGTLFLVQEQGNRLDTLALGTPLIAFFRWGHTRTQPCLEQLPVRVQTLVHPASWKVTWTAFRIVESTALVRRCHAFSSPLLLPLSTLPRWTKSQQPEVFFKIGYSSPLLMDS